MAFQGTRSGLGRNEEKRQREWPENSILLSVDARDKQEGEQHCSRDDCSRQGRAACVCKVQVLRRALSVSQSLVPGRGFWPRIAQVRDGGKGGKKDRPGQARR